MQAPVPSSASSSCGPLAGVRIIEFAGIGPGPFSGMMLADMGADVIVIDRAGEVRPGVPKLFSQRGKRSLALDLKSEAAREVLWKLIESADGLIEGYRPGVMERLGLGPDAVAERNPRLVYGRVTGWGQTGPLAKAAGHDINYVALTGASNTSRRPGERPVLPPTLLGDMAGGGMFLSFGLVCALLEAKRSGRGQVIDAAMIDGVSVMGTLIQQMRALRWWSDEPSQNLFLNGSPFYETFECADGKWVTLGAIEPQFYAELVQRLGLDGVDLARQNHTADWPALQARVAARIKEKTRDEWCTLLEGTDVCFAPVLDYDEAVAHPHNVARNAFVDVSGYPQPAPAPRLSRTPARVPTAGTSSGQHTDELLAEIGCDAAAIAALRQQRAVA